MNNSKSVIGQWKKSFSWFAINTLGAYFPSRHGRKALLGIFGARIGKTTTMFMGTEVRAPSRLVVGEGCSLGARVLLDARAGLTIGNNVTIAREAVIWTMHHDYNDSAFRCVGDSVTVGDYAWLCSRSIVLPGVEIGNHAVVASGSVVTKSVDPFTVVGGVPARKIAMREQKVYRYVPSYPLHIV